MSRAYTLKHTHTQSLVNLSGPRIRTEFKQGGGHCYVNVNRPGALRQGKENSDWDGGELAM